MRPRDTPGTSPACWWRLGEAAAAGRRPLHTPPAATPSTASPRPPSAAGAPQSLRSHVAGDPDVTLCAPAPATSAALLLPPPLCRTAMSDSRLVVRRSRILLPS